MPDIFLIAVAKPEGVTTKALQRYVTDALREWANVSATDIKTGVHVRSMRKKVRFKRTAEKRRV